MRPLVFGLTLAALLFVVSQVPGASRAHNDNDGNHGQGGITHYAHCYIGGGGDGHHTRWYYVNYSENWLQLYNKFAYGIPQVYKDAFVYAQVYWNAQPTRVLLYSSSTTGTNLWTTYSSPDQKRGKTESSCYHAGDPHQTVYNNVWLNRFYLDGTSQATKQTVALHEVGHGIGLGHSIQANGGNPLAVMWTPTSDHGFQSPQTDDVCGVQSMYRSNTYQRTVPPCHADHVIGP